MLGEQGSKQLVGMGDVLYTENSSKIIWVHGPFVQRGRKKLLSIDGLSE